ncbi:adenylate/guanylate cyclase domain-containing protein [Lichenifustis flavocetrariae]|uniref:Adenylate/guanylate cyclase domain-containing protein n=1 Tax=Lichenifustis flavocetrariae TaxID=2949735 RepID=A0AA41YUQ1_9HYPH|nr:adenylate/guanylate cyclase domain-containing protein [Lichenifustis flavocetrariae]MCW6507387.1 adenylate/guanylate cyclase domain-containing protein [Lichenifustis flavocetrariae]
MHESDALFTALRNLGSADAVRAIQDLVRDGSDEELARTNPLSVAAAAGLPEDAVIATFLHAARLGLFEMSWNVLCPHCSGVLNATTTLKTVRESHYYCAFCDAAEELHLDNQVEVSFTVSPRLRHIGAHDPGGLTFWDYHRQVFFGSGVAFPKRAVFDALAQSCMLETLEVRPGERMILTVQLPESPVVLFDPITHTAHLAAVEGEPTVERQDLSILFDSLHPNVGRSVFRPGPLRVSFDNRTQERALLGVYRAGPELDEMIGGRRPFLTAKHLLSNQTFRDIYRTDTLDVDQRLKIMSLTFLFTDLKGSTELYERVGDLVAYDLVRAHFRLLHEIVASESGAVVKTIGDAVMATFTTPDRAVSAALRMQDSMRQLNAERGAEDLTLKIGLHEGPCLAVSLNDRQDYFGQTVNIASRVQNLATSDSIFATEPILLHAASADLLASRHIGSRPWTQGLRGIGDRVPVFELAASDV